MSFKRICVLLLMFAGTVFTAGCSDFLNGKKEEAKDIELSNTKFVCLQVLPESMRKLSIGEASAAEVENGFDCMADALDYFSKKTFGSLEGAYTSEEIRSFFGKYFLKKNNVTPEFSRELMKIKKALLGGSDVALTREEIARLIKMFKVVRDEVVFLNPHLKVLLQVKTEKSIDVEEVSQSVEQLRAAIQKLLKYTEISKSDYSFSDLKAALEGFSQFIRGEEKYAPYDSFSRWIPIIEALKNVLLGEKAGFVNFDQWSSSADTLVNLYKSGLVYKYVLGDLNLENPKKAKELAVFLEEAITLLENSHQMRTKGYIPKEQIDVLIDRALPMLMPKMNPSALKSGYRMTLNKFLDPERKKDPRAVIGIERKHLATLRQEFNVWRLSQSFVNELPVGGLNQKDLSKFYTKFDFKTVIAGLDQDPFTRKILESSWDDFGDLLARTTPMAFNTDGKMLISANISLEKQTWFSLTRFNLLKSLARFLMLGYADTYQTSTKTALMSEEGLIAWFDDFVDLGIAIKAFDPRSANSGARGFLEANFFTFSGNGDKKMDHREAFEFVNTLFAAGLSTSNQVYEKMNELGCAISKKDVFDNFLLEESCFKKNLRENFDSFFVNLPGMVSYVKSMTDQDWDVFYAYLKKASVAINQEEGYVETANIRTSVTILHYVEVVMMIYDKDRSQNLSLKEVYSAAPRFMSFLKTVSPISWEFAVTEGFAYMIFKGNIPSAGDMVKFQWEKIKGLPGAQRGEIVRLFGVLKDQLNKKAN